MDEFILALFQGLFECFIWCEPRTWKGTLILILTLMLTLTLVCFIIIYCKAH